MGSSARLGLFLLAGLAASILLALGLLLMKSRGEELPAAEGAGFARAITRWFADPVWTGGLGVETAGYVLYVIALAGAPVSILAVVMQAGIAIFVVLASVILAERANVREWIGIGGIVAAMVLLGASLEAGVAEGSPDARALALLTAAGVVAAMAARSSPVMRRNGVAEAIASGIAFGLGSLYTKALTDAFLAHGPSSALTGVIFSPWLYLTTVANLGGMVMLQNSFHRARGIIAMPLSSACSNIVPIIGGMVAFGEALPSGGFAASARVTAFALTIVAGALLAAGEAEQLEAALPDVGATLERPADRRE